MGRDTLRDYLDAASKLSQRFHSTKTLAEIVMTLHEEMGIPDGRVKRDESWYNGIDYNYPP